MVPLANQGCVYWPMLTVKIDLAKYVFCVIIFVRMIIEEFGRNDDSALNNRKQKVIMRQVAVKQLEQIPGVGKKIAQDMRNIGINSVVGLQGREAEQVYQKLWDFKASPVDRCMLDVFRSAIYYAQNSRRDPELLKWWNWKDKQ